MIVAAPAVLLGIAACLAFAIRKRVFFVAVLTIGAIVAAGALLATGTSDSTGELLGVGLRLSPLARLAALILLTVIGLLVIDVAIAQPAYNFFPTALGTGAVAIGVLTLTTPLPAFALLLIGLLIPVGSFTFQIDRNRSVEAALRHFSFVVLGGCLGLGALALATSLPRDQPPQTVVLLVVLLFVAFALLLAAIPFHTHAALLAAESPVAALGLYFGVLVPLTFIAFAQILATSGLLPAIIQAGRVQDLILGVGVVSAVGGALLACGAHDLRRLVVYAVISNLGAALTGIATFSAPGIIGGVAIALVTSAAAAQQLLAAGALERNAGGEPPQVGHAPLAAAAFIAGGVAMIGAPPLMSFPGHFFVELIAYAVSPIAGTALFAATLILLIAQLRAGVTLFRGSPDAWRIEARPSAGIIGIVIFVALVAGGIAPDAFLRPIGAFADEFLKALRPR